jgi:hypothetical protein
VIGRAKKKRRKFARKKKKFTASNTEQSEELPEERRLGATSTPKLNHSAAEPQPKETPTTEARETQRKQSQSQKLNIEATENLGGH